MASPTSAHHSNSSIQMQAIISAVQFHNKKSNVRNSSATANQPEQVRKVYQPKVQQGT